MPCEFPADPFWPALHKAHKRPDGLCTPSGLPHKIHEKGHSLEVIPCQLRPLYSTMRLCWLRSPPLSPRGVVWCGRMVVVNHKYSIRIINKYKAYLIVGRSIRAQWKDKAYLIAIIAKHLLPPVMCCWYGLEGRREARKERRKEGKKSSSERGGGGDCRSLVQEHIWHRHTMQYIDVIEMYNRYSNSNSRWPSGLQRTFGKFGPFGEWRRAQLASCPHIRCIAAAWHKATHVSFCHPSESFLHNQRGIWFWGLESCADHGVLSQCCCHLHDTQGSWIL